MGEIIVVRKRRCEGCLYSPAAVARNAAEGRKDIAKALPVNPTVRFYCHCHWSQGGGNSASVCCRGFYDAHKEQLPPARFTKKKGAFWQWWKRKAAGCTSFLLTQAAK